MASNRKPQPTSPTPKLWQSATQSAADATTAAIQKLIAVLDSIRICGLTNVYAHRDVMRINMGHVAEALQREFKLKTPFNEMKFENRLLNALNSLEIQAVIQAYNLLVPPKPAAEFKHKITL